MGRTLGALMRDRRRELGLTQELLAERALLSVQAVGALERGERNHPRRDTLDRLIDALRLTGERRSDFLTAAKPRRRLPRTPAIVRPPMERPPRQLPPDVPHFTGRAAQVEIIVQVLRRHSPLAPAIAGMAGIGKTALAIHVAHRVASRFPDGQLYLNLRGYGGGEPMECHEALRHLLPGLGESIDQLPVDIEQAIAYYRSCLAGRSVLLVLDNAESIEQIRPLLPATDGCAALVTSRRTLSALPQLHHVPLGVLSEREGLDLLAATIGRPRIKAEPEAAVTVVQQCGHLPLAVHLAGARLVARPHWPIAHLAGRLDEEHRRLDELSHDEIGVRASLAVSVDQLADSADPRDRLAATGYAFLGLLDTTDLSIPIAAQLLDRTAEDAESILEHLVDLNLLEAAAPGWYHLHDLVRVHAHQTALASLPAEWQAAALTRVLKLYAAVAWRGQVLMSPMSARSSLAVDEWTAEAPSFDDSREAFGWLDDHRLPLLCAMTHAAGNPGVPPEALVRLAIAMFGYYTTRSRASEWYSLSRIALDVSGSDRLATAVVRMDLGLALGALAADGVAEWEDAFAHLRKSLAEFEELDHKRLQAACLLNLGCCLEAKGNVGAAISYVERSLALNKQLADHHCLAAASMTLGDQYRKLGNNEIALQHYQNCLSVSDRVDYSCGVAGALRGIGVVHRGTGRHEKSLSALSSSVELFRQIGDPDGQLSALEEVGSLQLELGDYPAAREVLAGALDLAQRFGHRRRRAGLRHSLGIALAGLGRHSEARAQWESALGDYGQLDLAASDTVRALLADSPEQP